MFDLGLSEEVILFKVNKLLVLLVLKPKFRRVLLSFSSIETDYEAA